MSNCIPTEHLHFCFSMAYQDILFLCYSEIITIHSWVFKCIFSNSQSLALSVEPFTKSNRYNSVWIGISVICRSFETVYGSQNALEVPICSIGLDSMSTMHRKTSTYYKMFLYLPQSELCVMREITYKGNGHTLKWPCTWSCKSPTSLLRYNYAQHEVVTLSHASWWTPSGVQINSWNCVRSPPGVHQDSFKVTTSIHY
jgi:hypothetical protein